MGMFSFLDKPFRTGATQAAKNAKKLGNVSLAEQGALRDEIGGIYDPRMQAGNQAFSDLADFYGVSGSYGGGYTPEQQSDIDMLAQLKSESEGMGGGGGISGMLSKARGGILNKQISELEAKVAGYTPAEATEYGQGGQQKIINQAMSSPFMSQLVDQGEEAIARSTQRGGGFRTGTTEENLAGNSQNVLMNLVQQMLSGKQGIANQGYNATDAYTTAMQNIVAGQGATRGQIANVDINKAAQRQNMIGGLVQSAATAYAGA